eukprot:5105434-Amphidinium_carterae.1
MKVVARSIAHQARESINSKKAEMQDKRLGMLPHNRKEWRLRVAYAISTTCKYTRQEITDVRSDVIRRTTTYQDTLAQEVHHVRCQPPCTSVFNKGFA